MSIRFCLAAVSVLLAGFGAAPPSPTAGSTDSERGHRLFDVHCARCHGIGGGGGEGPSLTRPVLRRAPDDAALVDLIRNGIPRTAMTGSFALSEAEASLVALYVRSLGRTEETPILGEAARGRAIYDDHDCAACHIVAGEGRGIGPELTAIGALRGAAHLRESVLDAPAVISDEYRLLTVRITGGAAIRGLRVSEDEFALVVRDGNAALHSLVVADLVSRRREMGESLMPSYADRMSADEIEDLVAYLASLRGEE